MVEGDKSVVCISGAIRQLMESSDDASQPIPLPNIPSAEFMEKIIEFCKHHPQQAEKPHDDDYDEQAEKYREYECKCDDNPGRRLTRKEQEQRGNNYICQWDRKFCGDEPSFWKQLLLTNAYLGIYSLSRAINRFLVSQIKDKTSDEIYKLLKIENRLTKEQEQE